MIILQVEGRQRELPRAYIEEMAYGLGLGMDKISPDRQPSGILVPEAFVS